MFCLFAIYFNGIELYENDIPTEVESIDDLVRKLESVENRTSVDAIIEDDFVLRDDVYDFLL